MWVAMAMDSDLGGWELMAGVCMGAAVQGRVGGMGQRGGAAQRARWLNVWAQARLVALQRHVAANAGCDMKLVAAVASAASPWCAGAGCMRFSLQKPA